jgi:tRNA 2-thiouridine synthesizing protein C
MAKSILVVITKGPYGFEEAFAGLRLALGMMVSGQVQKCGVLLIGDGTLNAVKSQKPEAVGMPSNAEAINDLTDFDMPILCVSEDLQDRVGKVETLEAVKLGSWDDARAMIEEYELVNTF